MKIEIGEYYFDPIMGDTVQVTMITKSKVYFIIIEDPDSFWDINEKERELSTKYFITDYTFHLKGYNTPLWKAINL